MAITVYRWAKDTSGTYASFAAWVTAQGTTKKSVAIGQDVTLLADLDIPSTIDIVDFYNGSRFSGAYNLTINKMSTNSRFQIFDPSTTVYFTPGAVSMVYPEWFGSGNGNITFGSGTQTPLSKLYIDGGVSIGANITAGIGNLYVVGSGTFGENINMSPSKTIDGVDLSELNSDFSDHTGLTTTAHGGFYNVSQIDNISGDINTNLITSINTATGILNTDIDNTSGILDTYIDNVSGQLDTFIDNVSGQLNTRINDSGAYAANISGQLDTYIDNVSGQLNTRIINSGTYSANISGQFNTRINNSGAYAANVSGQMNTRINNSGAYAATISGQLNTYISNTSGQLEALIDAHTVLGTTAHSGFYSTSQVDNISGNINVNLITATGIINTYIANTSGQMNTRINNSGAYAANVSGQMNTRINNSGAYSANVSGILNTYISNTSGQLNDRITNSSGQIEDHIALGTSAHSGFYSTSQIDNISGNINVNLITATGLLHTKIDTTSGILDTFIDTVSGQLDTRIINSGTYGINVSGQLNSRLISSGTYAINVSGQMNTRINNSGAYAANVSGQMNTRINNSGAYAANVSGQLNTNKVPYSGATMDVNLGTKNLTLEKVYFNTNPTVGTASAGKLYWDANYNTLSLNLTSDANLQIGQENVIRVVAGENIADGNAVYFSGVTGIYPLVRKAVALWDETSRVKGIATETINVNTTGFITNFGIINGLNTNSWNAGDTIYLSSTSGVLSNVLPLPPNRAIAVGRVLVKDTVSGSIFRSASPNYPISADQVSMQFVAGSDKHSQQDLFNTGSAGIISGGTITGSGVTFTVSSGCAIIAIGTADTDPLVFCNFSGKSATTATDARVTWVAVNYSGCNPQVVTYVGSSATDYNVPTEINYQDVFPLGYITRVSGELYITNNPRRIQDAVGGLMARFYQTIPLARDEKLGGLILGETGTRNVTLSAGKLWDRQNSFSISAISTATSGVFSSWYRDSGTGFVRTSGLTQWPNTQYDTGVGTLQTVANNRYANLWWYLSTEGSLVMVYGRNIYLSAAVAADESVPATLPLSIYAHFRLIARTTFHGNTSTFDANDSAFANIFNSSAASSHNNLGGLQGGTAGEYYHLTAGEYGSNVSGLGTSGYLLKYLSPSGIGNSNIFISGSYVGIGTVSPRTILDVVGDAKISTIINSPLTATGYLVSESGIIKNRTPAQVLTDIVAASGNHNHGLGNSGYFPIYVTTSGFANSSMKETATEVVINDVGSDTNFRVEGDTNSKLIFVDAGEDSVGVGTTTFRTMNTIKPILQVESTGPESSVSIIRNVASSAHPRLIFGKARGSAIGSSGAVLNGDVIGGIEWQAADGEDLDTNVSYLRTYAAQSGNLTSLGSNMRFAVTPLDSVTVTEAMRISDNGNVSIGIEASGYSRLDIRDPSGAMITTGRPSGSDVQNDLLGGIQAYTWDGSGSGPEIVAGIEMRTANANGSGGRISFLTCSGTGSVDGLGPVEKMRLSQNGDLYVSGNVCIGDMNPDQRLEVHDGNIYTSTVPSGAVRGLKLGVTGSTKWWISPVSSSGADASKLYISTGDEPEIPYMTLTSSGIAIGNNLNPTARLDISGNLKVSSIINSPLTASGYLVSESGIIKQRTLVQVMSDLVLASGNHNHGLGTSGYLAKYITASGFDNSLIYEKTGSLGINTVTPTDELHISGTLRIENIQPSDTNPTQSGQDSIILSGPSSTTKISGGMYGGITWISTSVDRRRAGIACINESSTDDDICGLAFYTNDNDGNINMEEAIRISRNKRLGIGVSNPQYNLDVLGNAKITSIPNSLLTASGYLVSESGIIKQRTLAQVITDLVLASGNHNHGLGTSGYIPKYITTSGFGNSVLQESSSNIGIGISPVNKLHIYDSGFVSGIIAAGGVALLLDGGQTGQGIYTPAIGFKNTGGVAGAARVAIAGVQDTADQDQLGLAIITHSGALGASPMVEVMRVNYSGDVCINTIIPSGKLDICLPWSGVQNHINFSAKTNPFQANGDYKIGSIGPRAFDNHSSETVISNDNDVINGLRVYGIANEGISCNPYVPGLTLEGKLDYTDPEDSVGAVAINGYKQNTRIGNSETVLDIQNSGVSILSILGSGRLVFPSGGYIETRPFDGFAAAGSTTLNGLIIYGNSSEGGGCAWQVPALTLEGVFKDSDPPDSIGAITINGHRNSAPLSYLETILDIQNSGVSKFSIGGSGQLNLSVSGLDKLSHDLGDKNDYNADSTIQGWSSYTNKSINYTLISHMTCVNFLITGTSNHTLTSFTIPYTQSLSGVIYGSLVCSDNGGANEAGYFTCNGQTVTCYRYAGAWTNSGTKMVGGNFSYVSKRTALE